MQLSVYLSTDYFKLLDLPVPEFNDLIRDCAEQSKEMSKKRYAP